jgi:hypothetical protein
MHLQADVVDGPDRRTVSNWKVNDEVLDAQYDIRIRRGRAG